MRGREELAQAAKNLVLPVLGWRRWRVDAALSLLDVLEPSRALRNVVASRCTVGLLGEPIRGGPGLSLLTWGIRARNERLAYLLFFEPPRWTL
jgi:hypothetical protein